MLTITTTTNCILISKDGKPPATYPKNAFSCEPNEDTLILSLVYQPSTKFFDYWGQVTIDGECVTKENVTEKTKALFESSGGTASIGTDEPLKISGNFKIIP